MDDEKYKKLKDSLNYGDSDESQMIKSQDQLNRMNDNMGQQSEPVKQEESPTFFDNVINKGKEFIQKGNDDAGNQLKDLNKIGDYYALARQGDLPEKPQDVADAQGRVQDKAMDFATMGSLGGKKIPNVEEGSLLELFNKGKKNLVQNEVSGMTKLGQRAERLADEVKPEPTYSKEKLEDLSGKLSEIMQQPKISYIDKMKALAKFQDQVRLHNIRGIK